MKGIHEAFLATTIALGAASMAHGNDPGQRDALHLEATRIGRSQFRVAVNVRNDQKLAGLDIPLRFGLPTDSVKIDSVRWSSRVEGWELKHAAIDTASKTIVIGLISDLSGTRSREDLAVWTGGAAAVVTLYFTVGGNQELSLETFTTRHPDHALMFYYNRFESGRPYVEEFRPEFNVAVSED